MLLIKPTTIMLWATKNPPPCLRRRRSILAIRNELGQKYLLLKIWSSKELGDLRILQHRLVTMARLKAHKSLSPNPLASLNSNNRFHTSQWIFLRLKVQSYQNLYIVVSMSIHKLSVRTKHCMTKVDITYAPTLRRTYFPKNEKNRHDQFWILLFSQYKI